MNRIFNQIGGVYKTKAYIEYDIEAANEEDAIERLSECVRKDLEDGMNIRDIADVGTERISDGFIDGQIQ